jgi:hypothetical protein
MLKLGGAIAGLKAQSTQCFEFCAREASQIFALAHTQIKHNLLTATGNSIGTHITVQSLDLTSLAFQCQSMEDTEAMLKLGGAIAGLKAQSTQCFEFCVSSLPPGIA